MQAEEANKRKFQRVNLPPLKEARIYFGQGTSHGVSEKSLRDLVEEQSGLTKEDVKRVIVRKGYSFFDVLDEQSDGVLDKLAALESKSGGQLVVKKATVISTQRSEQHAHDENTEEGSAAADGHGQAEVA